VKYYNQNGYAAVPYPSVTNKTATVKSGGCGVCCAATVLSFFNFNYPPNQLAPVFIARGARVDGGTDMKKAAALVCEFAPGVSYCTTSSETELAQCLLAGGIAIANVGGDRPGHVGVFSNAGHYVVVCFSEDGKFGVFDVGSYDGKFNKPGRKEKVTVKGDFLLCSEAVLHEDTLLRSPNYYLFKKEGDAMNAVITNPTEAKALVQGKAGLSDATVQFLNAYKFADALFLKLANGMSR